MNNITLHNATYSTLLNLSKETGLNTITYKNNIYLTNKAGLLEQENATNYLFLYDDSPAIRAGIDGPIVKFNGKQLTDWASLGTEIAKYSPGDNVTITTKINSTIITNYNITLGKDPTNSTKAWIGVGYAEVKSSGVFRQIIDGLSSFKKKYIYYQPRSETWLFVYNLIWWLVLISISVALMNMLPMGIFDGGRFFYLTIFSLTKSKKKAELWFKISTNFLLFLFLLLMVFWGISFIK
jgi:membrane-associated protease RseP (regulator of RpoE activity)